MKKIKIPKNFFNKGIPIKIKEQIKTIEYTKESDKLICEYCGNDSFKIYIKTIIDDAQLICFKCNKSNN